MSRLAFSVRSVFRVEARDSRREMEASRFERQRLLGGGVSGWFLGARVREGLGRERKGDEAQVLDGRLQDIWGRWTHRMGSGSSSGSW